MIVTGANGHRALACTDTSRHSDAWKSLLLAASRWRTPGIVARRRTDSALHLGKPKRENVFKPTGCEEKSADGDRKKTHPDGSFSLPWDYMHRIRSEMLLEVMRSSTSITRRVHLCGVFFHQQLFAHALPWAALPNDSGQSAVFAVLYGGLAKPVQFQVCWLYLGASTKTSVAKLSEMSRGSEQTGCIWSCRGWTAWLCAPLLVLSIMISDCWRARQKIRSESLRI